MDPFQDPALFAAVKLSLVTSLVSTLLSLLIAVPSGYVLSRCRFPGRTLMDTLVDIPIVLPPLVMGLALLIFFSTPVGRFLDRGIWDRGLFVYQPPGNILRSRHLDSRGDAPKFGMYYGPDEEGAA